jgi:hypothetical protein
MLMAGSQSQSAALQNVEKRVGYPSVETAKTPVVNLRQAVPVKTQTSV